MKSRHEVLNQPAQEITRVEDGSISLVLTSPSYPMIEMWDEIFSSQNPAIGKTLDEKDGLLAFELMHDSW